jgi:short-subunit dehydrogenase involved in D-alanine esterification of teichoic acids
MTRKIIIQIAYNAAALEERAQMLIDRGHEVISILGNSDALRRRDQFEHADVVVLGHAADVQIRRKMAQWVKQSFPALRLVAIGEGIQEADVTVSPDGREDLVREIEK